MQKLQRLEKMEEANFARIQGTMARQQAKLAQLQTITKTGTSLMTMGSGSDRQWKHSTDLTWLIQQNTEHFNNA
jgi:hypothetical protein